MDRREGDMGSSDIDDYSWFLLSHVHRCSLSHLEECVLDNLLPSEVSFSLICFPPLVKSPSLTDSLHYLCPSSLPLALFPLPLFLSLPLPLPPSPSPSFPLPPPLFLSLPLPSSLSPSLSATQGSGSTYIYGHCDANFKSGMTKDECLHFVTNGKR